MLQRKLKFTEKALFEMEIDELDEYEVAESIVSARSIAKTIRSNRPTQGYEAEKLYVIKSDSHQGTPIYTKGCFRQEGNEEVFYILISAKLDRFSG